MHTSTARTVSPRPDDRPAAGARPAKKRSKTAQVALPGAPIERSEQDYVEDSTQTEPAEGRIEAPSQTVGSNLDPDAAAWAAQNEYPEGDLSPEARAEIRGALNAFRPIRAAVGRYRTAVGRGDESLRQLLARVFAWGAEHRARPELVNGLLERHRVKATAAVRGNIFLAALKLTHAEEKPDVISRWAASLAFCAARGCPAERVADFLKTHGVREAADSWKEIRNSAKPRKPLAAPPDPIEALRAASVGLTILPDCPVRSDAEGPFILLVEPSADGLSVLGMVSEQRIISSAIRHALPVSAQT